MTNKEIATHFQRLGKIMDLHGENKFKTRSYYNAYDTLRKFPEPLEHLTLSQIEKIDGVGKAISEKIIEIIQTGELNTYNKYAQVTPQGIIELLNISGIGPKKVRQIWKELGVEDPEDLLKAIEDNRLIKLSGFGMKTQEKIRIQVEYYLENSNKYLLADVYDIAHNVITELREAYPEYKFALIGDIARQMNVVDAIEVLSDAPYEVVESYFGFDHDEEMKYKHFTFKYIAVESEQFGNEQVQRSASSDFLEAIDTDIKAADEEALWKVMGCDPIPAFYRNSLEVIEEAKQGKLPDFIQESDLKGIVHNHSNYSDGVHTLKEMCDAVYQSGYEYFVISDHSKAAFYANGLDEKRVEAQWEEIDQINALYTNGYKVFKGIECDILSDGSMDFDDTFLQEFEVVVASIHSPLSMSEKKATSRLVKAIENPHVHILGHPTGRKLTVRKGYPIDHMKVIDACAQNGVSIEINANPYRLDIDWSWIPYCIEKGVLISINPDAHSMDAIHNVKYGVLSAQKGGLTPAYCLNAKNLTEFSQWLKNR